MPPKTARQLDRFSQFGLVAGQLALEDAGLRPGEAGAAARERIGIYLGSALGGIAYAESQHERYLERGIKAVAPNLALAVFGGAAPANLGIALDVRGPILSTANSCASGAVALGEALNAIRAGDDRRGDRRRRRGPAEPARVRRVRHHPGAVRPATTTTRRRPAGRSTRDRDGFVMGEGVALPRARGGGRRPGARRRAVRARSWATARRPTRTTWSSRGPTDREAARAATIALDDAGVDPAEIDWVSAHASSTPLGDIAEARAIARALGERAATVPVSGTKALYGHPLGASGAIEAAICALAIRDGWVPASANLVEPEAEVGELLPGLLRGPAGTGRYDRILSTSFGFGGLNAALVVRRGRRRIRAR